jgi:hypothetical protein
MEARNFVIIMGIVIGFASLLFTDINFLIIALTGCLILGIGLFMKEKPKRRKKKNLR